MSKTVKAYPSPHRDRGSSTEPDGLCQTRVLEVKQIAVPLLPNPEAISNWQLIANENRFSPGEFYWRTKLLEGRLRT